MIITKEKNRAGKGDRKYCGGGGGILDRVARKSSTRRHSEKAWRKRRNQPCRYLGKEHS